LGFRTSLISFKVHRFYMYEANIDNNYIQAHKSETMLHKLSVDTFAPKTYRVKFTTNNDSEWFAIEKKDMTKFLNFLDDLVYNRIKPEVLTGTAFTKNTYKEIKIKKDPRLSGFNGKNVKDNPRIITNEQSQRLARSIKQVQTISAQFDRDAKKRKENDVNKSKLAKDEKYWKDIFMGKTFYDKKMYYGDKGKFPHKKITGVFYHRQVLIEYEAIDEKLKTQSQKDKEGGYITVNEMLDNFKDLKKKNKESYEYYKDLNNFEDDIDYAEIIPR
jgi:hypothetical protein